MNIISQSAYESIENKPNLNQSFIAAYPFQASEPVKIQGEFKTILNFDNKSCIARYLVLRGDAENLLGYAAANALGLITLHQSIRHINCIPFKEQMIRKYPKIFEKRIGKMEGIKVTIETDPNIRPLQQPPHKIPFHLRDLVSLKMQKFKDLDIIREVLPGENVTWISPLHIVPKFDNVGNVKDVHCTGNYVQLNKAIIPFKRYMPSIGDIMHGFEGLKWFSLIDVTEAFLTTPLSESSQLLTVFGEGNKLWKFTRMNMGLKVASEIFQEIMTSTLRGIKHCKVATDDVLIGGETVKECETGTEEVFRRLSKLNVTVNSKCDLIVPKIRFYGLEISEHGIKPAPEKLNDFLDAREPTSSKALHSFLGTVAHFANRIPYSALLAKPLRELLKKGKKFNMEERQRNSFITLKESIITNCMAFFKTKWHIFLFSDAGPDGCAGMLTQENPKDISDVSLVGCGSHCFSESECNYSHLEKEAYGIVWCCEFFHAYVYGAKFTVLTDSLSAQKIFSEEKPRKKLPIRLIRLKSRLQLYGGVTVKHIEGKKNIADFLSRHMPLRPDSTDNRIEEAYHLNRLKEYEQTETEIIRLINENLFDDVTLQVITDETQKDEDLSNLIKCITGKAKIKMYKSLSVYKPFFNDLWISKDGIIMKDDVIVLPNSLKVRAVDYAHKGHLGIVLIKRLLKSRIWFNGLDTMLEDVVKDCLACQSNTNSTCHAPLIMGHLPDKNSSLVSLDFSSETPTGEYLLVANYERSRFPAYRLSRNLTAKQAILHAREIFEKYGFPESVKTDNGPAFSSKEFKDFLSDLKIKHIKITPLNPEANGGCERFMEPLNKCIRCAAVEGSSWKKVADDWIHRYRATPHTSTGIAPEVAMGLDSKFMSPSILKRNQDPATIESILKSNDRAARSKQKFYADQNHKAKLVSFEIGDHVLHKWPKTNKHQPAFDPDAYTITKRTNNTIEATRSGTTPSYLCRNCRFFKKINDKCFESSMKRRAESAPPAAAYKWSSRAIIQPPQLPASIQIQNGPNPRSGLEAIGLGPRNQAQHQAVEQRAYDMRSNRRKIERFDEHKLPKA